MRRARGRSAREGARPVRHGRIISALVLATLVGLGQTFGAGDEPPPPATEKGPGCEIRGDLYTNTKLGFSVKAPGKDWKFVAGDKATERTPHWFLAIDNLKLPAMVLAFQTEKEAGVSAKDYVDRLVARAGKRFRKLEIESRGKVAAGGTPFVTCTVIFKLKSGAAMKGMYAAAVRDDVQFGFYAAGPRKDYDKVEADIGAILASVGLKPGG